MLGSGEFGDSVVIADFEAGIGTITRLANEKVDVVLVVVEPTPKSLEVGTRAADLAREKMLGRVIIIASRVRDEADLDVVRQAFPGYEIVPIPDDASIVLADRRGISPLDLPEPGPAVKALSELAERLAPVSV
ncbi:MAG: dehydrogenase maturation factor [Acidimicrobiaceae bacterium]|nr:dehydrogenase maturation factor [Acidimicrobiaceae bacterium]